MRQHHKPAGTLQIMNRHEMKSLAKDSLAASAQILITNIYIYITLDDTPL